MKKNLILGAAVSYSYITIRPFITTLRQTNFDGDVCLIVADNLSSIDRKQLSETGVILITVRNFFRFLPESLTRKRFSRKLAFLHKYYSSFVNHLPANSNSKTFMKSCLSSFFNHIACSRYGYFYRFLFNKGDTYEKILLTDVRDVIFQSNPFSFSFDSSLLCFLEDERETIGSQSGNANWIRTAFGDQELNKIAHCRISCSGTTLGNYQEIMNYLSAMINCLATINHKIAGFDGFDQGVHNYLIWNHLLSNIFLMENGKSPIITMHGMPLEKINIDTDGIVRNYDGSPVSVLHQYDRHPDLNFAAINQLEDGKLKTKFYEQNCNDQIDKCLKN